MASTSALAVTSLSPSQQYLCRGIFPLGIRLPPCSRNFGVKYSGNLARNGHLHQSQRTIRNRKFIVLVSKESSSSNIDMTRHHEDSNSSNVDGVSNDGSSKMSHFSARTQSHHSLPNSSSSTVVYAKTEKQPDIWHSKAYSNKFLRWVKLSSEISDAAEAIFKSEVWRRGFVTMILLIVCRAGYFIPLPGYDRNLMPKEYLDFSHGTMEEHGYDLFEPKLSLFQLGLTPHIFASTMMQLACYILPAFQKLRKDGETDKIKTYMWRLTLCFAALESLVIAFYSLEFSVFAATNWFSHLLLSATLMTTGAMLLEWICQKITEDGFGQGSTLIICMSILINCSNSLSRMVSAFQKSGAIILGPSMLLLPTVFLLMTVSAVLVTEGRRTLKLHYYGLDTTVSFSGAASEVEPYVPFDINPTGMMPVLVSSYVMSLPGIIASVTKSRMFTRLKDILNPTLPPLPGSKPWLYYLINAVFIFVFSILDISGGTKDLSEYLNRIGAKIPDVKPGKRTIEYLTKIRNSTRFWGGILLALLVTLSTLVDYKLRSIHQGSGIGFTSMLFIVGSIVELRRSFIAYNVMPVLTKVLKRFGA